MLVTLGDTAPAWELSRWASSGLRFIPPNDEGFVLRGDRQRLVYKGYKKSHRFTILGDTAFEYDCILEREPESNVIALFMEGAECFDFFRQPDFVKDPFLKGSYAVYRKETPAGAPAGTPIGAGTGKLCHIHRPLIRDSRGRKCWGDLSVTGNKLSITIPEAWLSEAEYPVVVDPTIGTETVGSQTYWYDEDNESYDQLFLEVSVAVNRFYVSETFTGTATAYVYVYNHDAEGRCKPVLYSDNNNVPLSRLSKNEGEFDVEVYSAKPAGWRSTTFQANEAVGNGSYVWFGLFCDWFAPRFDFGAKCYRDFWYDTGDDIPDTFPLYDSGDYYDFKLSAYFSYVSAYAYTRTLTQGVTLLDTQNLKGSYQRKAVQTVRGVTALQRFEGLFRKIVQTVKNTMTVKGSPTIMVRIAEAAAALYGLKVGAGYRRGIADSGGNSGTVRGMVTVFRILLGLAQGGDSTGGFITRNRVIQDTETVGDETGHVADYLRGLFVEAGSIAGTSHRGEYYRLVQDWAESEGVSLRHLFMFIRFLAGAYIRDYTIWRFLKSKEELMIKSPVCREIILSSKIN
jgi:hypothetical protein